MLETTFLERAALIVLMLTSASAFGRRFGRVVDIIQRAKPTPGFQIDPISKRIATFVWEVLFQVKVIQERPLPGIAHAFVFWGFCAFALITVNHFATGFGLEFLSLHSAFGKLYLGMTVVWGAAVAISIAALFIRRFFVKPVWLGKVSVESGFIAMLIFTLMITFLISVWYPAARINWWIHTLALLVFLPLVPHTKHLHLILSPLTIFLRRDGFSAIPPLEGDDDFGLRTGKDVTRIDALQAFSCVECGRCTEHCPAHATGKVLNPKELILGLRDYLNKEGPESEHGLLNGYISEEAAFQCTTCGACEYQCPVGIQHLPMIIGLRRGAVNTGEHEDEHATKLFLNLERNGNSLGLPASDRQKFIEKNELPYFDGTQEYCLWLGCMGAFDPQGRDIVLSLTRLLKHAGVTYGVLQKEKCTGDAARRLGNDLAVSELATANIETIKSAKATKLVSICPHCVRTIKEDWREFGETIPIEHHSELLARIQHALPVAEAKQSTVYHDPCYLGRYQNIYEEPRQVVEHFAILQEPQRTRERSFCCGAGGGQMFLGEEKGTRVNRERADELIDTGAEVIATACPFCQSMFKEAIGATDKKQPILLDIAQIAAARLPVN